MFKQTSTTYYLLFYFFLIVLGLYYSLIDPFKGIGAATCIIHKYTGLFCPGCGLQRALHAFFSGDFALAFSMNPLAFLALVVLCVDFLFLLLKWERLRPVPPILNSHAALIAMVVILILFMILRNVNSEYLDFLRPIGGFLTSKLVV